MIFRTDNNKDFFELNPSALSFEWLSKCSSREAKWICLVYDYQTPLRNIPIDARKEVAAKMAGFLLEKDSDRLDRNARNVITGKIEKVNCAITEFMSIQYDEEKELVAAYKEQIAQSIELLRKKNKSDKEWSVCDKLIKTLPLVLSAKKELEVSLGFREESSGAEYEDEPLSALDMFHEED